MGSKTTKPPDFAPLKTTLARSKGLEGAAYQVIEQMIDKLMQMQTTHNEDITDTKETITTVIQTGGVGGAPTSGSYITSKDESIVLPSSLQLLPGIGISFDDSVPNKRTISVTGAGGGGTGVDEVYVGTTDPGAGFELWYDTDEPTVPAPPGPPGPTGPQGPAGPAGTPGGPLIAGGTAGQILTKIDSTDYNATWLTPDGAGNVVGPTTGGSIDTALALWNGTTGRIIKNCDATYADGWLSVRKLVVDGSSIYFAGVPTFQWNNNADPVGSQGWNLYIQNQKFYFAIADPPLTTLMNLDRTGQLTAGSFYTTGQITGGTETVLVGSTFVRLTMRDPSEAANARQWAILNDATKLQFQAVDDAYATLITALSLDRSGNAAVKGNLAIGGVAIGTNNVARLDVANTFNGNPQKFYNSNPVSLILRDNSKPVDGKAFQIYCRGDLLTLQPLNDAENASPSQGLYIDRASNVSVFGSFTVGGPTTGYPALSSGDIRVCRADNTGYTFHGNTNNFYIGYDGTKYILANAPAAIGGSVTVNGNEVFINSSSYARVRLYDGSQPTGLRNFSFVNTAQEFYLLPTDDAGGGTIAYGIKIDRSGNARIWQDIYEKQRTTPMGHWIPVAYNAANFASAVGTWTGHTQQINTYCIIGKTLIWNFWCSTSTLSAATLGVTMVVPGGLTLTYTSGWANCSRCTTPSGRTNAEIYSNGSIISINSWPGSLAAGAFELSFTLVAQIS